MCKGRTAKVYETYGATWAVARQGCRSAYPRVVVTLIISVYDVAIGTIMMCCLEDEARDAGDKPSLKPEVQSGTVYHLDKSISDAAKSYCRVERNETRDVAPCLAQLDRRKLRFGLRKGIKLIEFVCVTKSDFYFR